MDLCEYCDEELTEEQEEYAEATCIAVCDECVVTYADEIHEDL